MFRKRNNSLKPPEAFYNSFREGFPQANLLIPSTNTSATTTTPTSLGRTLFTFDLTNGLSDGLPEDLLEDHQEDLHDAQCDLQARNAFRNHANVHDSNRTPRAYNEPWISSPPIFYLNAFRSGSSAELFQGYHKPTARWAGTFCETEMSHSDVLELQLGLETTQKTLQLSFGSSGEEDFGWIENTDFISPKPIVFGYQHPSLAENDHLQNQSASKPTATPEDWIREEETHLNTQMQHTSSITDFLMQKEEAVTYATRVASLDRFRFHVKLYAPTAIVKDVDEEPISYLNKGQVYLMSIIDTAPKMLELTPTRYRTSIRISFKDEAQGLKPNTYWQLWRDGRGAKEAEKHGGQLQGVEYVEVQQATNYDGKVELDTSSIDGFSIIWSQGSDGSAECHVAMRFNFLSTDFSYAKGVQGIPSRLCAKTVILCPPHTAQDVPQVSFCEVKLFRDHGAERKHINDIAYVNRSIGKVMERISKVEAESDPIDKKRRRSSASMNVPQTIRSDQPSYKGNWSMAFKSSAEDGLQAKLLTFQNMLMSTRPTSILSTLGQEMDDPDRQPIVLTGESPDPTKAKLEKTRELPQPSSISSTICSNYTASVSDRGVGFQLMTSASTIELQLSNAQHLASPPTEYMDVEMVKHDDGRVLNTLVETLQVVSTSRCTAPPELKPVACFYTLHSPSFSNTKEGLQSQTRHRYQAIYLYQRTAQALAASIAAKYKYFHPARKVDHIIHLNKKIKVGIEITVDDDFVREMREGQDMLLKWRVISVDAQDEERFELQLIF